MPMKEFGVSPIGKAKFSVEGKFITTQDVVDQIRQMTLDQRIEVLLSCLNDDLMVYLATLTPEARREMLAQASTEKKQ